MRKILGPVLTLLLLAGVSTAIYLSVQEQWRAGQIAQIRGLIGSEKEDFFHDPRVVEALRRNRLEVEVIKAGSRQIATGFDLKQYDFAFPAGVPAAEKMRREHRIAKFYPVFFTPMAVASWKRVVQVLEANGIVRRKEGVYYIIDLKGLLQLIGERKRWNDLPHSETYPVGKNILITSTDVRKSNSAAMYLALASYILNGSNVVSDESQIEPIIDELAGLYTRQGFLESSSQTPFEDYLVMGPGKSPLVMLYEAQFLYARSQADSPVSEDMVLLYPEPTVYTKHILVPLSEGGERLGQVLTSDPELKRLAIEHGLRNDDRAAFRAFVERHRLAVPEDLFNVIEPPSYEILERMITLIEQRYEGVANHVPAGH